MTEYWKAIPKYFCTYCNCHFADNAATISRHEAGARHKMNKEIKLKEIKEKAIADEKARQEHQEVMRKMNEGAMQGMMADLNNADVVKKYGNDSLHSLLNSRMRKPANKEEAGPSTGYRATNDKVSSTTTATAAQPDLSKWQQATTPDGKVYYWHADTKETRWELPKCPPASSSSLPAPTSTASADVQRQKTRIKLFHQNKLAELESKGTLLPGNDSTSSRLPEPAAAMAASTHNTSLHEQLPSDLSKLTSQQHRSISIPTVQQLMSSQVVSGYSDDTNKLTTSNPTGNNDKSRKFVVKERDIPTLKRASAAGDIGQPNDTSSVDFVAFKKVKQSGDRVRITTE